MYSIFITFKGGVYKIKKKSIERKKHAKTEYIEYICKNYAKLQ